MAGVVIFIAGILAGWIAEWLFFTFVVKKKNESVVVVKKAVVEKKAATQTVQTTNVPQKAKASVAPKAEVASKAKVAPKSSAEPMAKAAPKAKVKPKAKEAPKAKPEAKLEAKAKSKPKVKPAPKAKAEPKDNSGIDFTKLKGVGPKLADSLAGLGIKDYSQLADHTGDQLIAKLEKSGAKVTNKKVLAGIPEQAAILAKAT